ncbi:MULTISPECIES: DMT family transporter [Methanothrix]|jgi:small multidrug resistance pump|uniref:Multidrug resistance protein, SMR family n=4 Tax=root TaxID=1 RepID=F4BWW6_METSG|nr:MULTISPECIES: multidrug efflux SMR transporter [Methanothrix]NYT09136.1 multidrug efflux SMR transporter [Methanosarcinales archaeon]OPX81787.1 MAG: multidrug efflux protein [Methanosaeta sp. PtaB.Bin005]AEB67356.1 multidrug resistance protein, SMR family [Methanothrix soehngenii GP6]MBP7068097.1 multidrug efflux SMR transporter [Methanothrix sp.]MDY0412849.1 multidrug efflux SMR transporter [Methanothrix soehngenii]
MQWLFLFLAIIGEVIGTSALKASDGFTKIVPSIIVVAGYAVAFFFLSLTLKDNINIGVVYAIWSGVGVSLISVIGYLYYKQSLDIPALLGIALIIIGVMIINLYSKSVMH